MIYKSNQIKSDNFITTTSRHLQNTNTKINKQTNKQKTTKHIFSMIMIRDTYFIFRGVELPIQVRTETRTGPDSGPGLWYETRTRTRTGRRTRTVDFLPL